MNWHPIQTDPPEPHTALWFSDEQAPWLGEFNEQRGRVSDYADRKERPATHWALIEWPDPP